MEGLALRVTEGHAKAAPVLRRALARLRAASELKEIGIPLAVLVSLATDDLWDIESLRESLIASPSPTASTARCTP